MILFAQQSVKKTIPYSSFVTLTTSGYPSPPYKIIIMDEADSLTMDAQSALRRVMETYSKVTRFCFICNYISKIIPALSSRCARFEFGALPRENVVARLRFISEEEKMTVEEDVGNGNIIDFRHYNTYMNNQKEICDPVFIYFKIVI